MIAVARTADLVIMVLDACKKDIHKEILTQVLGFLGQDIHKEIFTQEMESVGIRLNQKRPDIYFKVCTSFRIIPFQHLFQGEEGGRSQLQLNLSSYPYG